MNSQYTLYLDTLTGDVDTLVNWQEWNEMISKEDPILQETTVQPYGEPHFKTNIDYCGDLSTSEWISYAKDDCGVCYELLWSFVVVKGSDPGVDDLPWHDDSYIEEVSMIYRPREDESNQVHPAVGWAHRF